MSIYLAWSLYKLIGALVILGLILGGLLWAGSQQTGIKSYKRVVALLGVFWLAILLVAAFNIGDRQASLHRSSFNATFTDIAPEYVPPPPDSVKAAREALEANILKLNNSIKEKQHD